MRRRSFMQLVAAAIMTPSVRLMAPCAAAPVAPVTPTSFMELVLARRDEVLKEQAQAMEDWLWEAPAG